jgi:aspartate aminotransferase-like enzyme
MTPDKSDKNVGTARAKCAHPSCKCLVSANGKYGECCSEYCKENAAMTELRCQCEHVECR